MIPSEPHTLRLPIYVKVDGRDVEIGYCDVLIEPEQVHLHKWELPVGVDNF
jgi:hypothetical protein